MDGIEPAPLDCPYCGEIIECLVDCSVEQQEYIEDCSVCCRPIHMLVTVAADGALDIDARTDDE